MTIDRDHRRFLTEIFDRTAPHYDRINGLMSFGSGGWYRRDALRRAGLRPGMKVLDVAVGTGAVAHAALGIVGPAGRVAGLDPSIGMLRQAKRKLGIALVQGLAEHLPFEDGVFDFLSMGYALRHVANLRETLAEYFRVVRPGGAVLLLDFARPRSRPGLALGRLCMSRVLPWVSQLASGSRDARVLMQFCWDTVETLPAPAVIVSAMTASGFEAVRSRALFGVLSEYAGRKP